MSTTETSFYKLFGPNPKPDDSRVKGSPAEDVTFDQKDAYAVYNWEPFFHLPLQAAVRFGQDQQSEVANRWFHSIFNPEGSSAGLPMAEGVPYQARATAWVTKAFVMTAMSDYMSEMIDSIFGSLAREPQAPTCRTGSKHPSQRGARARTRPMPSPDCDLSHTRSLRCSSTSTTSSNGGTIYSAS